MTRRTEVQDERRDVAARAGLHDVDGILGDDGVPIDCEERRGVPGWVRRGGRRERKDESESRDVADPAIRDRTHRRALPRRWTRGG